MRCPNCDLNVAADAEFCPGCGKKKPGAGLGCLILIVVGALVLLGLSSGGEKKSGTGSTPQRAVIASTNTMVGKWRANSFEFGRWVQVDWNARSDGTTSFRASSDLGVYEGTGTWQLSDGILSEQFSDGLWGRASITWLSDNQFELTIIAHGSPEYVGVKRVYTRQ